MHAEQYGCSCWLIAHQAVPIQQHSHHAKLRAAVCKCSQEDPAALCCQRLVSCCLCTVSASRTWMIQQNRLQSRQIWQSITAFPSAEPFATPERRDPEEWITELPPPVRRSRYGS